MNSICLWCDEEITGRASLTQIHTPEGKRWMHIECGLRSALGGIGHWIDHDHFCTTLHDPDAGLTAHESAILVQALIEHRGTLNALEELPI